MSTEFSITSYLRNMWTRISDRRSTDQPYDDEFPLRSELFSADQMALYGKALASGHVLAPGCPSDQLLSRLADNERTLVEVCTQLTAAVAEGSRVTPAAEWLLDNFYLIEEQIGAAKRLLPKGYSLELPPTRQGTIDRTATGLRYRTENHCAWRWPCRCRRPQPLRGVLPDGHSPQSR